MTDQPELDDAALANGDGLDLDAKLAGLFNHYRPRLYSGIKWRMRNMPRRLASRVDPSDVLQDAYLAARRQYPRFLSQNAVPLLVWLRRLVLNRLKNALRYHRAQRRDLGREQAFSVEDWDRLSDQLASWHDRPDRELSREEWKQKIRLALHQLPQKYQLVILLRFYEGQSNHQVASHFHMRYDSAATNLLGRALRRLKQLVESPDGGEEELL